MEALLTGLVQPPFGRTLGMLRFYDDRASDARMALTARLGLHLRNDTVRTLPCHLSANSLCLDFAL